MSVSSKASRPEYILKSSSWSSFLVIFKNDDYNINRLVKHPTLALKCKGIKDYKNSSEVLCQNGGKLYISESGMRFCDCVENYYGITCDMERHSCPPVKNLRYPSTIVYLNSGEVLGSLATVYCKGGLEPKHFLSVCKAKNNNPDDSSAEWVASDICHIPRTPTILDRASISVLYTETDATVCKFLACPNKSSNHYKKPSPVHISGLNIVKHTKVTHRTYFQAWKA